MSGRRTASRHRMGWLFASLLLCGLLSACSGGPGPGSGTPADYVQVNEFNPLPTPTFTTAAAPTVAATFYTVQEGDTLGGIAVKFDVTVADIVAANNISDPNSLSVGQKLLIPPRRGSSPATASANQPTTTQATPIP